MAALQHDQRARLSRRSAIRRSRASNCPGRGARDRCRACRAHRRRRHCDQSNCPAAGMAAGAGLHRQRSSIAKQLNSCSSKRNCRRSCAACSSSVSAVRRAAVKKIDSLLARAGDDDRVRGAFKYHGAATGRWSRRRLSAAKSETSRRRGSRGSDRRGRDRRLSST